MCWVVCNPLLGDSISINLFQVLSHLKKLVLGTGSEHERLVISLYINKAKFIIKTFAKSFVIAMFEL